MLCAVRLDVIRGCSMTYCYSSRCSAETAKINLMVFAHVVYCVVELKYGSQFEKRGQKKRLGMSLDLFRFPVGFVGVALRLHFSFSM